jgi:ABC-2 type transport system permease protein
MMLNLVKNEMIKVFANKKIYAFLIIILLIELVPVFGSLMVKVSTFTGQTYPLFLHGLTVSWVIPIFIAVLISDMFTEEYVNGTLTLSLIHPVTRSEMIAAKAVSVLILILFLLVFTMFLAYVIGLAIFGWEPQFMIRGIEYSTLTGIQLTIYSFLSSAIPLLVFGIMVMFLALLFYSSGIVVGVSIGLMLLFAFLGYLLKEIEPYLITGYFSSFPNSLLFTGNNSEITMALKVMALYGIFFFAASITLFKKKDLFN